MRWLVVAECECLSANREVIAIDRMYAICVYLLLCKSMWYWIYSSCTSLLLFFFIFFFFFFHFNHPIRLARIVIVHVFIPYIQDISTMIYFMILSLHNRTEELRVHVRLFDIIRLPCILCDKFHCFTVLPNNKNNGFVIHKKYWTIKFDIRVCAFSPVSRIGIGNGIT